MPTPINLLARLTLFIASAVVAAAAPGDWPQWGGPNRDGLSTETGLLKEWPPGGPSLVWKAAGLGIGYSSIAISGQRIFTIGDANGSSFVIALGVADGKPIWSSKLGKAGAPGWGGFEGPRATPTVDGDLLYAVGQWGELVCLESATGKERWRKDYVKDFGGTLPEWGYVESPLIDGARVIVTPGGPQGAVVALDKKTGAVVWRSEGFTDLAQYPSLVFAQIGGVRQCVQLTMASVAGVALEDGKLLWRAPRKGSTAVVPTPICDGDFVYVTSGYGAGCNLFKVSANGGKFQAKEVYANKVMANHHGGAIKVGDHVYGWSDGKGWTFQDFKSGQAKWHEKEKFGKGSVVYADGHFYLRSEDDGVVALIDASPKGYREHGRFKQPGRTDKKSWTYPVIAGRRLYLRDQDLLLCYDIKRK